MGEIVVLCQRGDIKIEWDPKDTGSVERAKTEFDRLRDDGYDIYRVQETKGARVTKFEKGEGRLIAAPGVKKSVDKEKGTRKRAMAGGPNARTAALR